MRHDFKTDFILTTIIPFPKLIFNIIQPIIQFNTVPSGKSILITELQPDGGKRMAANAFLNGKRIAAGTVLDA